MFEETSQTEDMIQEFNEEDFTEGFEENFSEAKEEPFEQVPEEEQEEVEEQPENQPEPTYAIKYNGQELEIPASEMVTLAQKGMNYDHVYGELQALRQSPERTLLERYAQESGMSREEYLQYLSKELESRQISARMEQGLPEQAARRMLELERKEKARQIQEQAARQTMEKQAQYNALAREYPGLKELPPQVVQAIREGESPLAAYRAYENQRLRQELEAAKYNSRNQGKAMGSMSDSAAAPPISDFLSGWDSE